jgi:multiple sugar transport system permease protein
MFPLIAWQLVFTGIPLVMAFIQSLETGPLIARVHPFVGFDNYTYELTQDPTFITTIRNTVIFAATAMLFGNVASLGLALLVSRIRRLAGLFRTIFYLPSVCTAVAVASVWKFIYNTSDGILNQMLTGLGLPGQDWLGLNLALPSIIGMSVWWGIGGGMLIYLAGLQGVDATLYEAARVDGAGSWRLFWHVTLTQLRPMLVFQSILGIIGGMQVFTQTYLLTQGGPVDASRSMVEYMYETAFSGGGGDFGTGAAISFMLFALVFVLVATELWLVRRRAQA